MPVVIDVNAAEDPRDLVHRAVQALAEGKLVAFPTDTLYCVAASATHPSAVARLATIGESQTPRELTLAIKSADEAWDYAPRLAPMAVRLARRCWPGPLTLSIDAPLGDSLVDRLPPPVASCLTLHDRLNLRVPAHPLLQSVLRLTPAPLVVAEALRSGRSEVGSATLGGESSGSGSGQIAAAATAAGVVENLGDEVQLILDDGPSRFGQPATVVRCSAGGFEVRSAGALSEDNLRRLSSFMLIFVCTGNTCRSPMAEVLMRKRFADKIGCPIDSLEERGIWVLSAGVAAMAGGRASAEADEAVSRWGVRLNAHESQPLSERLVRFADLMLTMTRSHRDAVLAQWPDAAGRVRLLTRGRGDVGDPIGGPLEEYQRCANQIDGHLDGWLGEIAFDQVPYWKTVANGGVPAP